MSRRISNKRATDTNIRIGRLLAIGLALACLVNTLLAAEVYAESSGQVTLSVEQIIINDSLVTLPRETFTYRLAAKTPNLDAPMPHGSGLGGFTFTITETDERLIGPINFDTPGIFIYELSCITDREPGFSIDRRVYTIEVHVTNDLQITVIVYIAEGIKVPDISFTHVYRMLSEPVIPGSHGPERPGRIPNVNRPTNPSQDKPGTPSEPSPLNEPVEPVSPSEPIIKSGSGISTQTGTPGNSPRTGDFSNPTLWIILIVIAGVTLVLLAYLGRQSKGGGDD